MKKGVRRQDICLVCGKSYYKYRNVLKYCSRKCSSQTRKINVDENYNEKIRVRIKQNITIYKETGCWVWTRYKSELGRGNLWYNGKTIASARVSYMVFKGNIPENYYVCHACDNPTCVNPDHLWIGTYQDNTNDRENKKRGAKGEKISISKLKEFMICEIKKDRVSGMTQQAIAEKYNVHQSTISNILRNRTWKHA